MVRGQQVYGSVKMVNKRNKKEPLFRHYQQDGWGEEGGQLQRERDNKPAMTNLAQMTKSEGGDRYCSLWLASNKDWIIIRHTYKYSNERLVNPDIEFTQNIIRNPLRTFHSCKRTAHRYVTSDGMKLLLLPCRLSGWFPPMARARTATAQQSALFKKLLSNWMVFLPKHSVNRLNYELK